MTLHNPPLHSLYNLKVCKHLFGPCNTHIPLLSYTLPCSSYALKVIWMTAGQQPQLSEKECKWSMHLHSSHYFPIQRNVTVSPATFTLPRPATTSVVFLKQVIWCVFHRTWFLSLVPLPHLSYMPLHYLPPIRLSHSPISSPTSPSPTQASLAAPGFHR